MNTLTKVLFSKIKIIQKLRKLFCDKYNNFQLLTAEA